ncbi:hypothetical protein HK100_009036 [Physocladia obscura]|uniref:Tyrosine decarboxylase n=1 Tax=Physocladia obscura TaxID=109957 RepID=A0AAD5SNZ8_9FUNG|nr:hypothetical protein HK100_009036 [Physocladia obscura]
METRHVTLVADLAAARTLGSQRVRPTGDDMRRATEGIVTHLPATGLGLDATFAQLVGVVAPGIVGATGPRYFGFVTGGVTPAAQLADFVVAAVDANVQVHLPLDSVATRVEAAALEMAASLSGLDTAVFAARTVTTGATASNVLGLACARDAATAKVLRLDRGLDSNSRHFCAADDGLFGACRVVVLHAHAHASIAKAASLVGIGRKNCFNLAESPASVDFDLVKLDSLMAKLAAEKTAVILVASCGEVNTGNFTADLPALRALCNKYGNAWLHVDAAFGAFAPNSGNLNSADSLTIDAHKWLNVPYDCGLFYTRSLELLQQVCSPSFDLSSTGPAYLSSSSSDGIPSPLTVGIENSRRFRALPLYASLICLGREGYEDIFARNIAFANRIAKWIHDSPHYDLLNHAGDNINGATYKPIANIVLFGSRTATDDVGNSQLVSKINDTGLMYVTGTKWAGRPCIRLAVSNWQTGKNKGNATDIHDPDFDIVINVLIQVL